MVSPLVSKSEVVEAGDENKKLLIPNEKSDLRQS